MNTCTASLNQAFFKFSLGCVAAGKKSPSVFLIKVSISLLVSFLVTELEHKCLWGAPVTAEMQPKLFIIR